MTNKQINDKIKNLGALETPVFINFLKGIISSNKNIDLIVCSNEEKLEAYNLTKNKQKGVSNEL